MIRGSSDRDLWEYRIGNISGLKRFYKELLWRVIGGRTMTITSANDINSLYNVSSDAVRNSLYGVSTENEGQKNNNNVFGSILDAAVSNINTTNDLLSSKENEQLKWMMGISENTHDLTIAVGKAQSALNYTVALRDKLLEAYKEIMQIQI